MINFDQNWAVWWCFLTTKKLFEQQVSKQLTHKKLHFCFITDDCNDAATVDEEKKQREHLLALNQVIARQVMEKSRMVAGMKSTKICDFACGLSLFLMFLTFWYFRKEIQIETSTYRALISFWISNPVTTKIPYLIFKQRNQGIL